MKKNNTIGRFIALMMVVTGSFLLLTGCVTANEASAEENQEGPAPLEILTTLWAGSELDFPTFGGSIEYSIAEQPGTLDVTDENTMTHMLILPKDLQKCVTDAATQFHMMNLNTYTAAALRLNGVRALDAADQITQAFRTYPFLDGTPDKIAVYTVDPNTLLYFWGTDDIVDILVAQADQMEGAHLFIVADR